MRRGCSRSESTDAPLIKDVTGGDGGGGGGAAGTAAGSTGSGAAADQSGAGATDSGVRTGSGSSSSGGGLAGTGGEGSASTGSLGGTVGSATGSLPGTLSPDLPKVGVPDGVSFQHKWQISLAQIDDALRWGVRKHVVLGDAGYGDCSEFRQGLIERGLQYLLGVQSGHCVWPPGVEPSPPTRVAGNGRPRTYWTASEDPVRIEELACSIP